LPDSDAQIIALDADKTVNVTYPVSPDNDKAFIFFSPPGETVTGSLSASIPLSGSYNFEWFQYNTSSGNFDIPRFSETAVEQSIITGLDNGGYRVRIWNNSGTDTLFTAWVHIDKLYASVAKDAEGNFLTSARTCDFITLSGAVSIDTFYYIDPVSQEKIRLKNSFKFKWTSDPQIPLRGNDSIILDPNTKSGKDLPFLDTWFILTAIDQFGMKDVDSVFYESIQVKPSFKFKVYDKEKDRNFIDETNPFEGDAPMIVKFINESINAANYEWIFADSARSEIFANEFSTDLNYEPEFIYRVPNSYYQALVAISEAGCIDTFNLDPLSPSEPAPLTVIPSLLEVPNVFSPDQNGQNDYFKVNFKSMKEFSLRIFDRAGQLVYKAEVTDMYLWEGWDGNILDSDRPASPGAYYYVIDATGWDNEHYHKGQYRGVVYLYREE